MDVQSILTYTIVAIIWGLVALMCLDAGERIGNGILGVFYPLGFSPEPQKALSCLDNCRTRIISPNFCIY